jgi:hypothetical protein
VDNALLACRKAIRSAYVALITRDRAMAISLAGIKMIAAGKIKDEKESRNGEGKAQNDEHRQLGVASPEIQQSQKLTFSSSLNYKQTDARVRTARWSATRSWSDGRVIVRTRSHEGSHQSHRSTGTGAPSRTGLRSVSSLRRGASGCEVLTFRALRRPLDEYVLTETDTNGQRFRNGTDLSNAIC